MSKSKVFPADYADSIPLAERFPMLDDLMKQKKQWVCLKDGMAINPKTGEEAYVDNENTWGSFAEACKYAEENEDCGIGFQLSYNKKKDKKKDKEKDLKITVIHFSNCVDSAGDITNEKVADIFHLWEESYAEFDTDGTGLTFLFVNTPVMQEKDYEASEGDVNVRIASCYECIPITGQYCETGEVATVDGKEEWYPCDKSKEEFVLSTGTAVLKRTYELFFGVKKEKTEAEKLRGLEIDSSLVSVDANTYLKQKLTHLLSTNKYFHNLWNRSTPTERGRMADEIDILARLIKYLSCNDQTLCKLFRASPYFRTRPKEEQNYYEDIFDPLEYFYNTSFLGTANDDDSAYIDPREKYGAEESSTEAENTGNKANDVLQDFASPFMRRLLDKAREVAKSKLFAMNTFDNAIDLIYDPIYETINTLDTDIDCAQVLINSYGNRLMYCSEDDCWYIYKGGYWIRENNKDLENIRKYGEKITKRLSVIPYWFDMPSYTKKRLRRGANKFSNVASLKKILEAARAVKPVTPDVFNTKIERLKVGNGTVNLKEGRLFKDNPQDLFTTHTGVNYISACPEPRLFLKFLNDIFCGDKELIEYFRRMIGYCITGETKEQLFFVFYGGGANGKSTLINILEEVLNDYVGSFDAFALAKKNDGVSQANPTLLQNRYARFVTISEKNQDTELDIALIKTITGGDKLSTRMLFQNNTAPFRPMYKMIFTTNYLPNIDWNDYGIQRRYKIIPFNAQFTNDKADPEIGNKILDNEKEQILKWLVDAAKMYYTDYKEKLGEEPKAVKEAFEKARKESDSVYAFAKEEIDVTKNKSDIIQVKDLRERYRKWCEDREMIPARGLSSKIVKILEIRKPEKLSGHPSRCYFFTGIKCDYGETESKKPQKQNTKKK
jgi:P4 family phage/plasmid primase-like protien